MTLFRDRQDAGERLARRLEHLRAARPLVLGLPRGGVPVAAEIARYLGAPLDVVIARKIGAPGQPELAIGAVATAESKDAAGDGTATVLNREIIAEFGLSDSEVAGLRAAKLREVTERTAHFRGTRPAIAVAGRTVILVDDGIATGATIEAALKALRRHGPQHLVLAVPVAAGNTLERLRGLADEVVCLAQPRHFYAIGAFYSDFTQVKDDEVIRLLAKAAQPEGKENKTGD